MNRYIAYSKTTRSWNERKVDKLMDRESAVAELITKKSHFWIAGISAARAVLTGKSPTKYNHISPVKEQGKDYLFVFSNEPIY